MIMSRRTVLLGPATARCAETIRRETAKFTAVIRTANIKPERAQDVRA